MKVIKEAAVWLCMNLLRQKRQSYPKTSCTSKLNRAIAIRLMTLVLLKHQWMKYFGRIVMIEAKIIVQTETRKSLRGQQKHQTA